ncbi:lipid biosynthesis B12-binding/radical SAM protein [Desulforhopalus singaporensis]|uniref:Lipid biosynthesis B12-binding/radical SAM protein n=1 Tax=Desulforhopalus singaporensis TaxID=91360 RepID=A0A1H0T5N4_9BACT|nr:lipid biosynthesis B12-binding/radical SAM protein [Desulforhopalus singaporensis]SDP48898.1 lipid biosynthesis B12-binding/radical SAM protein [Desulforhopalus singaporensis]
MGSQLTGGATVDCLIISANQVVTPYPVYPLGAAYITDALQRAGHPTVHFDMLADGGLQALAGLLAQKTFGLVGISIRNIDTVDSTDPRGYLDDVVAVARCVRDFTAAPVVLGGPAFSIMPEEFLALVGAEYGVVGEGERAVVELAGALACGRPPEPGMLAGQRVKRVAPCVGLAANTVGYYLEHGGMLNVQTKRGCPYSCGYCSYPTIEGNRMRFRDPREVVEEIVCLKERYGARYLFFADSVFNDSAEKYLETVEEMIRRDVSLPWCAFFRPQGITKSKLRLLKRAGLVAMELGTDAATDTTLAGLNKGFGFEEVVQVHQGAMDMDISCAHFIMFGGPGEDKETLARGLANIDRLDGAAVFGFVGIRILPKTAIFERAVSEGIISCDDSLLEPKFYYSPDVAREEIESAVQQAFSGRIDRIFPCHQFYDRIAMLHGMGHAGPLWDLLLKKRRQ